MHSAIRNTAILLVAAGCLAAATLALAGPLVPPAGPIGGTNKTLSEVEPRIAINATNTPGDFNSVYNIYKPGSYYLTDTMTTTSGKIGIKISASHVTIDLNGFLLSCLANSDDAIGTGGSGALDVTVRNGMLTGGGKAGVNLTNIDGGRVEDVTVVNFASCGIFAPSGSVVSRCVTRYCNPGFGAAIDTIFQDCIAKGNNGVGFNCNDGEVTFSNCRSDRNAGAGFVTTGACTFESCTAYFNNGNGFDTEDACSFLHCTSQYNKGVGILAQNDAVIEGCVVEGSQNQGIHVLSYCSLVRNRVRNGGGSSFAGIWLDGNANRAEDNESTGNAFGIFVGASGNDNFVARNTCRSNSMGNFAGGWNSATNEIAPIVTNPGSSNFASMTAWSNVAY